MAINFDYRKKRILIVDDDKEMCEEMEEIFIDEGYHVTMLFDGLEAQKATEKSNFDILLLDLKLPRLNGLEILKNIKEKSLNIKILILTGRPLSKQFFNEKNSIKSSKEEEILKLADGVINKPFNVTIMLDKLKELID